MGKSKQFKMYSAIGESILGIPVVGGVIVLKLVFVPLAAMFALHIVTLVNCNKEGTDKKGSIMGIITNALGWVPILGMIMHIITAVVLWVSYSKEKPSEG
jgi:hypothetical protein